MAYYRQPSTLCAGRLLSVPQMPHEAKAVILFKERSKMEKKKTIADVLQELNAKVSEGNKLIADNQPITADFLASFAEIEKAYAELKAYEVYAELGKAEKPMVEAIVQRTYKVKRHAEVKDKDTKRITEFKLSDKEKQIDLLKFAKQNDLDTGWQHDVAAFNQSLCLKTASELGFSKSEIDKLAQNYYMKKEAQDIADGKTPTSNNQLCKKLQAVIDEILPPEDEQKGNQYKCNNHDVAYIVKTYTRKGRAALSVAIAKDGQLRNLIADAMHRIITGAKYSVDYKKVKADTSAKKVDKKQILKEIDTKTLEKELDKRVDETIAKMDKVMAAVA